MSVNKTVASIRVARMGAAPAGHELLDLVDDGVELA